MSLKTHDQAPWLLTGCIALTLSGVSALAMPPKAEVAPAEVSPAKVTLAGVTTALAPATPAAPAGMDDGDGDELLEHWNDIRYSREERFQLVGLALFFSGAAMMALRRRSGLRKQSRKEYRYD